MSLPRRLSDLRGLRYAAWVRESTKGQQDRFGPETQEREIADFAEEWQLGELTRSFTVTGSGKTVWKHPSMEAMLAAADRHEFDVLVIGIYDRWQRNLRRFLELIEDRLHPAGVALVMADQRLLSSNPRDWQRMKEQANRAEDYSLDLGHKISGGLAVRFDRHADPWGHAPLGFRREGADPAGRRPSLLQVDPDTIGHVRTLFERYATGTVSIDDLAVDPPFVQAGRRKGQPMTREGIADLLANPIYNGWVAHKGRVTAAPWRSDPPIADELWERVQAVRQQRTRAGGAAPKHRVNLFTNLFVCDSCGTRIRYDGVGGSGTGQYHRLSHPQPCEAWGARTRRPAKLWEPWLIEQVNNIEISEQVAADVVAYLTGGNVPPDNVGDITFRREKEAVAKELVAGRITGTEAEARIHDITDRERQARPASTARSATPSEILDALRDLQRTWHDASPAARAQLIHAIYAEIPLRADGEFGEVRLTESAKAQGLVRALPEEVPAPSAIQGRLACPRGLEPPTFRSAT